MPGAVAPSNQVSAESAWMASSQYNTQFGDVGANFGAGPGFTLITSGRFFYDGTPGLTLTLTPGVVTVAQVSGGQIVAAPPDEGAVGYTFIIPEPTSLFLSLLAMAAFACLRGRRGR